MEPFRSPFYAPQFVALRQGHFADEGLDVTVRTAGGFTVVEAVAVSLPGNGSPVGEETVALLTIGFGEVYPDGTW